MRYRCVKRWSRLSTVSTYNAATCDFDEIGFWASGTSPSAVPPGAPVAISLWPLCIVFLEEPIRGCARHAQAHKHAENDAASQAPGQLPYADKATVTAVTCSQTQLLGHHTSCCILQHTRLHVEKKERKKKQIGHHARPRRASATAPLHTGADMCKRDQVQASAPGQNRTQFVGGATTHGRRTRQAGNSVPTQTRPGAGGCTPQSTPQEGTLQQDPNTLASCAKGTYGPGQLQGRAGTGQHKPWHQQRGYDWWETPPATPPPRGPTQSTPGRGHPGKGKCYRAVQARETLAFKQQMFNVAPSVFPSRLSPRNRTKIRTQGEDVIVAETTRRGNSCDPKSRR